MVFNVQESDDRSTVTTDELPFDVLKLENVPIRMKDGSNLYAHIWLPKCVYNGSNDPNNLKIGALVEYLPYRKNDFTAIRDSIRHPYYAGFGFASLRVDMRGCGDSDGVINGEYLPQEQEDNLAVFDWIIQQPWSNGNIGQFGKSWGGFNGLQVASKRHPALKTIITVYSTDDRYADDVHYRGGCILASDMLWWASTMLAYNARPQDPRIKPDWRSNWFKRLELEPNVIEWVKHQTRDEFWKHGSICENYEDVDVPVLAIGGWRDGYTNAVFRLVENLPHSESRGIIGPWVHEFPEVATPQPGLGFNQLVVKWFAKYLNTEPAINEKLSDLNVPDDFDIEKLSNLTAFIQEPSSIRNSYDHRDGAWFGMSCAVPHETFDLFLDLENQNLSKVNNSTIKKIKFTGSQEHGMYRGNWCPFGQDGDFPSDQKLEDSKCLSFDSKPFQEEITLLGFPIFEFDISSDLELAHLSVRLVDLDPDTNEAVLISWGIANLSHCAGTHETPKPLVQGEVYSFTIKMDALGYKIRKNHKLRLALSPTDWPSAWPLARTPTLTLYEGSRLRLPLLNQSAHLIDAKNVLPIPEAVETCERKILRKEFRAKKIISDTITNEWTIDDFSDEGERLLVSNGISMGSWNKNKWSIREGDPLSAFNQCDWELTLGIPKDNWQVKLVTSSTMEADEKNFILKNSLVAFENEGEVFNKSWSSKIPRCFN
ncbi:Piso0_005925 [Millerozyma farinosa CBS 7064]|uniref:Piso0_005925 protein n=1 Tax=Pichia sorbitophila (strain ATCC MYA-4447 / BCRC 22081 / CBS 7064 / NBRC 10061 / NRRL Y-12695) TaxID=559304 RepID=G8Y396_PICSO|nr:Piso0_005925 [Millerozyma farinosa CBS 7064]